MSKIDPGFTNNVSALGYIHELASDHLRRCKSHRCRRKWLDAMDMVEAACESADKMGDHVSA